MEIGHEIIFMAILPLLLIQEGQLSGTGERMCTYYWLNARSKLAQDKVWLPDSEHEIKF